MVKSLSRHGAARIAQRGVRAEALETVMHYGDRMISVGRGCVAVSLTKAYALELAQSGTIAPWLVDRVKGLAVVVANDNDEVVTVVRPSSRDLARSYVKATGYEPAWRRRRHK